MAEAIAVAVHLENVDVVCQPVEKGAGRAFGTEGFGPFVEGQVAGDQRSRSKSDFLALSSQRLGSGPIDFRRVA